MKLGTRITTYRLKTIFIVIIFLCTCIGYHERPKCSVDLNLLVDNKTDDTIKISFLWNPENLYTPSDFKDSINTQIYPLNKKVVTINYNWGGLDQCDLHLAHDWFVDCCGYAKKDVYFGLYQRTHRKNTDTLTPYLISLNEFELKTGIGLVEPNSRMILLCRGEPGCETEIYDTITFP